MRNQYIDVTPDVPQEARVVRRGLTTHRLIGRFTGTFCFDFGDGFRCGSTYELETGQELELEQTFSIPQVGLGLAVKTKSTVSQKWSHTSGRCETCLPIACHANSLISEWSHETNLGVYRHTSRRTAFEPQSRLVIDPNCQFSADCPGCGDEPYQLAASTRYEIADSVTSATIDVVGLEQIATASPVGESDLSTAVAIVDDYGEAPETSESDAQVVVIRQSGRDVELTTNKPDFDVALLSVDATDRARGGVRIRPDGTLPIFLAARALEGPAAWAQVTGARGEYVAKLDRIPVDVGRFTAGWGFISLPEDATDIGGLSLQVFLRGSSTEHIAAVSVPVIS